MNESSGAIYHQNLAVCTFVTICIRLVVLAIALNTCLSVHLAVDRNASLKHGIPFWCALLKLRL